MIDFLRGNAWCSMEHYLWGMSVGQIRLSGIDFSHIEYLDSDKTKKKKPIVEDEITINSAEDLKNLTDLGMPIINNKK